MRRIINLICCCIPIAGIRRPLRKWLHKRTMPWVQRCNNNRLGRYINRGAVVLWFDHALGGGTETYSMRQFKDLKRNKRRVIRIQNNPHHAYFIISTPTKFVKICFAAPTLDALREILGVANISQIVVNNLVGYTNLAQILSMIAELKNTRSTKPHVSFRGHDFYAICPSYNLINCDGKYCDCKYCNGCEQCWAQKSQIHKKNDNAIFDHINETISDWRAAWGRFFAETLDEMVVFSDVVKEMFIRIYPCLADKTVVIPHYVPPLRPARIPAHNEINIACLGIMSENKGRNVILEMCRNITPDKNVNIFVVGLLEGVQTPPKNLTVTGKYNTRNLPKIMERHRIDIVFIPSIWPETFSYTTAEAMSMGMPVACYNMGAPAERVAKYERGLVLDKIAPARNLEEIINFVKQKRKDI